MARGGQMFRAECKFPSFIQQQINICLAERVTVYTGVYLAIPYFICAYEGKLCRNTDVPLGPLATLGVKDVSPASQWERRRGVGRGGRGLLGPQWFPPQAQRWAPNGWVSRLRARGPGPSF